MASTNAKQPRLKSKHVVKSSNKMINVKEWLKKFKLTEYENVFIQSKITIEEILKFNDNQLSKFSKETFTIKPTLYRNRFLNAIKNTKIDNSMIRNPSYDDNKSDRTDSIDSQYSSSSRKNSKKSKKKHKKKKKHHDHTASANGFIDSSILSEVCLDGCYGYKMYLFVDQQEAIKYQCGICNQVSCNSVELSCNNSNNNNNNNNHYIFYCKLCISQYLISSNNICPINNKHKNIKYNATRYMTRRVNNLIIYCPKSNKNPNQNQLDANVNANDVKYCNWNGKLCEVKYHLKYQCKYYKNYKIRKQSSKDRISATSTTSSAHTIITNNYNDVSATDHDESSMSCSNSQQIDILRKQIANQHQMINTLNETNYSLKSKLNKITKEFNDIKIENKKLWDAINKINININSNNNSNSNSNSNSRSVIIRQKPISSSKSNSKASSSLSVIKLYYHPVSSSYETFHPLKLKVIKVHKLPSLRYVHSSKLISKITERKYHPKIKENNLYWTCCNKSVDSDGCRIDKTTALIYPCCGKKYNDNNDINGCIKGYLCCNGDQNSIGCVDKSVYPCCNTIYYKNKNYKINGCTKRYICCKRIYPNSKGCKPR